jgi:Heterokaryon incompatibility protein (HET)
LNHSQFPEIWSSYDSTTLHYIKPFIDIMRLLTRDARGELNLVERTGDDIPQYAILSHTWDKDGEVTYNDLAEGTGKDKPGYSKIKFCVEQAARDGLQYSWVDTCCIDKWNLEELSNAINSMFLWYQNSAKCYVVLSDVPLADSTGGILDNTTWETAFQNSRWFRPALVKTSLAGHSLWDRNWMGVSIEAKARPTENLTALAFLVEKRKHKLQVRFAMETSRASAIVIQARSPLTNH